MSDKFSFRGGDTEGVADGDYVLTVTGGHVTGLSPASAGGGSGVVETIVPGTGITVDDTDPANPVVSATGGGGGGGGAIHYADDLGGVNFTTTANGTYVTVTGLSLTITPAVAGVLTLTYSVAMYSTSSSVLNGKIICSPAPVVGPTQARIRDDIAAANKARTYSLTRTYSLAAGTTYTFTTQAYQSGGGTLTVFGDQEQTELSGKFVPS